MPPNPTLKKPTARGSSFSGFSLFSYSHSSSRALKLHPDKGGDPELFKEVTHAYVQLSCPCFFHVLMPCRCQL